jgi:hypothetical protein
MDDFIKFITHNRSAEAYIATMFTAMVTNLVVFMIVMRCVFDFNWILSILLAYIVSIVLMNVVGIPIIGTPYLIVDYFVRKIPHLCYIVYTIGSILLVPCIYVMSGGKQTGMFFIM